MFHSDLPLLVITFGGQSVSNGLSINLIFDLDHQSSSSEISTLSDVFLVQRRGRTLGVDPISALPKMTLNDEHLISSN